MNNVTVYLCGIDDARRQFSLTFNAGDALSGMRSNIKEQFLHLERLIKDNNMMITNVTVP